jgi:hypothetical protein
MQIQESNIINPSDRMQKIALGLSALALTCLSLPPACAQSRKLEREAGYQAALHSYTEIVQVGATRKEVEGLLKSRNTSFVRLCCVEEGTTFSDLIQIGKERHPWYCSEHAVYIAIEFVTIDRDSPRKINETDVVQKVTIWHHIEGCL